MAPSDKRARSVAVDRFRDFLRDHGLKFTQEREEILAQLLALDEHIEADELLVRMRRSGSKVSRATIYRTLDLLVQSGLARRVRLGTDHHYYEHVFGRRQHEHMICIGCGKIIEWFDPELSKVLSANLRAHGFSATRCSVQVIGYCADCSSGSQARRDLHAAAPRG